LNQPYIQQGFQQNLKLYERKAYFKPNNTPKRSINMGDLPLTRFQKSYSAKSENEGPDYADPNNFFN
jgi:hypothetical protein